MIDLYSTRVHLSYDTMTTIQKSHLTTCNSCIEHLAMTSGDIGEHCNLQSRHYLLAIFFLFCGVLLSSLNQSSAPQHVEGPLPRPAWLADLYTLSLASSRVVLPGDPDYSQVVQVSPGVGAGAPPGQVSPLTITWPGVTTITCRCTTESASTPRTRWWWRAATRTSAQ